MTEAEILLHVFTKISGKTDVELSPIIYEFDAEGKPKGLKPDAAERLLDIEAQRVSAWNKRQGETVTRERDAAAAKAHAEWENRLREKYKLPSDKKGDDLILELDNYMKTLSTTDGKGKNTKEYLELETKYTDLEKKHNEVVGKIGTEYIPKTEVERSSRLGMADKHAMTVLSSMKLVRPEDEKIQQNLNKALLKDLRDRYDDIEITSDGKVFAFKDGKRVENKLGHAVELSEIVHEVALGYYQEAKQGPTGNGGKVDAGGGGGAVSVTQFDAIINDPNATYEAKMEAHRGKAKALAGIK